jgi:hypothetical protein
MAGKKTEKKSEFSQKAGVARLRACDHCGEKVPAHELQAKLVISYTDAGTKRKVMQRVIKGHGG